MTEQPSSIGPDIPVKLQPLGFQLISDDGNAARYQALVEEQGTPGSAVLAITVTIASSVQSQAAKQLQALLGGMQAAFTLLPELPPDNGESSADEPFNINQQLLIEFSLASFDGPGPIGVAVTVQTTTGIVPVPSGTDPANERGIHNHLPHTLGANLDDYWQADSGQPLTATVKPLIGKGTIRNPLTNVYAGDGPYHLTAEEIIVHAGPNVALRYSMSANFRLKRHGVKGA
jgi:hypothetical protein